MSNSQQMKKGLSVRDLITTGILAALYMVCAMIGEAIFGFFPVLTFLCPLSIALLCGPVYMLILAKVPKHGPIIVTGILVGGVLAQRKGNQQAAYSQLIFAGPHTNIGFAVVFLHYCIYICCTHVLRTSLLFRGCVCFFYLIFFHPDYSPFVSTVIPCSA